MYLFEFRGRGEILKRAQASEPLPNESKIVTFLNDNAVLIAQELQGELSRGLSPSLSIQAQIHFHEGSIDFAGVIILLDALGTFSSSPDFPATYSRLAEIAIQGVLQKWILGEIDTDHFTSFIQIEVTQPVYRQKKGSMNFQNLTFLAIFNTVLLLILILLLIPSVLRNPIPIATVTLIPSSTSSITPTLTPSVTPSMTPSQMPTLTPSLTPFPTFTPSPTITPFP
jgi:hypothetical protein